jgi:hypothetical protein
MSDRKNSTRYCELGGQQSKKRERERERVTLIGGAAGGAWDKEDKTYRTWGFRAGNQSMEKKERKTKRCREGVCGPATASESARKSASDFA